MYHYTGCGLDSIWLLNGYRTEDFGEYGQSVVVESVELLEQAIGRHLAGLERPLTGQEFRFLRVALDISQTRMGRLLGKDYQTVARWEMGLRKPVPRYADAAMRQRYLEYIGERPVFSHIADALADQGTGASLADPIAASVAFERREDSTWHCKVARSLRAA